jgi:hypothetical protein
MSKKPNGYVARVADYQATFKTESGQKVMHDLMRRFGMLSTTFVAGDAYASAFNEGQRAVMVDICGKVRMDLKRVEKELKQMEEEKADADIFED